jgi:acyl-coenzyme A synthetase/AMP-(fatty) acid ligase
VTAPDPVLGVDSLHVAVARSARSEPDRDAISTHDRTLSVAELASLAGALTERLAAGSGPFLLAPRDAIEAGAGLIAASASGRPALVVDPRRSPTALTALAHAVSATVAVVSSDIGHGASGGLPTIDPGPLSGEALPVTGRAPDDILLLAGTSGSTATPKLVGLTHRSLAARATRQGEASDPRPGDRIGRTFNHTGAAMKAIAVALLTGIPLLALDLLRVRPVEVLHRFDLAGATHVRLVPSVLRRLLLATPSSVRLPTVRIIGGGGDPMLWDDVARLRPRLAPTATIIHTYGSTEVDGIARRLITMEEALGEGVVPVGRPSPGRDVWIDDGAGRPSAPGIVGEIIIDGDLLAIGPAFEDLGGGRKRHRTRDLGELTPDGELIHRGRVDRMVKIGGVRIEPGAVEEVLRAIPGVLDVAVVPEGDDPDRMRLVAHVVALPGAAPERAALRAAVAAQVTSSAVPAAFHLRTEPLPVLASGKVDRRALLA